MKTMIYYTYYSIDTDELLLKLTRRLIPALLEKGFNNIYVGKWTVNDNNFLKIMLNTEIIDIQSIHELFTNTLYACGYSPETRGGVHEPRFLRESWNQMKPAVSYLHFDLWKFSETINNDEINKMIELIAIRCKYLIYLFLKNQNKFAPKKMIKHSNLFFRKLVNKDFQECLRDLCWADINTRALIISSLEVILLRCHHVFSKINRELYTYGAINLIDLIPENLLPKEFVDFLTTHDLLNENNSICASTTKMIRHFMANRIPSPYPSASNAIQNPSNDTDIVKNSELNTFVHSDDNPTLCQTACHLRLKF